LSGGFLEESIASRLLASIEEDRLVILFGAGLSMGNPSKVPSAARLAEICSDQYASITGSPVPIEKRNDLEAFVEFVYSEQGRLTLLFHRLIPWEMFKDVPNDGHDAIADFLACNVFDFAVTTNVDNLVESAADKLGEKRFSAAWDGNEANRSTIHKPFLKIHGCAIRDQNNTLWCKRQLSDNSQFPQLIDRINSSKIWLNGHLIGRDLLILGFWSDWAYLNGIIEDCVNAGNPNLVVLVDPQPSANLETKAPKLWELAKKEGVFFHHEKEYGERFLDELRLRFSRQFLIRLLTECKPVYESLSQQPYSGNINFSTDLTTYDFYTLRKDCCGKPSYEVAREKRPSESMNLIGAIILHLLSSGATYDGPTFLLNSKRIRVIEVANKLLNEVKHLFSKEPLSSISYDIVICVGAKDDGGVKSNVVRDNGAGDIIRSGITGEWMTENDALEHLGVPF
jgi:hypothetical protein